MWRVLHLSSFPRSDRKNGVRDDKPSWHNISLWKAKRRQQTYDKGSDRETQTKDLNKTLSWISIVSFTLGENTYDGGWPLQRRVPSKSQDRTQQCLCHHQRNSLSTNVGLYLNETYFEIPLIIFILICFFKTITHWFSL